MCGIIGGFGVASRVKDGCLFEALQHRGPDGEGFFEDASVDLLLGHTRLAIIDLSDRAHQPMSDPSCRFSIVFNGEIYNYRELRAELESLGVPFNSDSDTETLLLGYQKWGEGVVRKLRGMFAFAIYDKLKKEIFLARDRFGIKPLIYSFQNGMFVFSSELKPLLGCNIVEKVLDRQALDEFYAFGSVLQPKTLIKNVLHLSPSHFMRVGVDGKHTISCYYKFPSLRSNKPVDISYTDAVKEVRRLLEKATRYHLVADVDIGAFLSGGVDSTAVVALMSQYSDKPIKAFSVGFDNGTEIFDESLVAKRTAKILGADFHRILIDDRQIENTFDDFILALDQPSIDGINTYLVSSFTAKHVKVALSGLGGDELFAGYPHFATLRDTSQAEARPLDYLARWVHRLRPNRFTQKMSLNGMQLSDALSMVRTIFPVPQRERMLPGSPYASLKSRDSSHCDVIQRVSSLEFSNYLCDTLLRDVDAVSMWHSLEVRPVLLDHELVEFVFNLPGNYKIRNGKFKSVFVDAIKDLIPAQVWQSPKRGFEMPFVHWMDGVLNSRFAEILESDQAKSIFCEKYRNKLRRAVKKRKPKGGIGLLLCFCSGW